MIPIIVFGQQRQSSKLWMMRAYSVLLGLAMLGGCEASQPQTPIHVAMDSKETEVKQEDTRMWMTIGEHRFAITLADNATARAFAARLPLTLEMADLNGNEKHADLPQALPTDASRPGTIHSGDLMLYESNTIVLLYETFQSSYAYTRLGRIDDSSGMAEVLGRGTIRITLSKE